MADEGRTRTVGPKALELIMRDVLDGMEELALLEGFRPGADVVEIVAIEPPTRPDPAPPRAPRISQVVPLAPRRRRSRG